MPNCSVRPACALFARPLKIVELPSDKKDRDPMVVLPSQSTHNGKNTKNHQSVGNLRMELSRERARHLGHG